MPRRLPVWLTEYGFQTNPPDPYRLSIEKMPAQMDQSEWIAFRNRRVRSYSQYTMWTKASTRAGASSATGASRWGCASPTAG